MSTPKSSIEIKLDVETKIAFNIGVNAMTDSPIDVKIEVISKTKKKKKAKVESSWCNLPDNVLTSIVERLYYVDQIRFRAVCKNWRPKIYGALRYADNFLWILAMNVNGCGFFNTSNLCYLCDPIHKQKYTIQNHILVDAKIHASKYGWLLLSREIHSTYFFSFYSPFTNKIIDLPALEMMISVSGRIFQDAAATFSAAPTSPDCVICVISTEPRYSEVLCISTCSSPSGRNFTWNSVSLGMNGYRCSTWISHVAFIKGVFYFTFAEAYTVMGAFKPGLREWKQYPYPSLSFGCVDSFIESDDEESILIAYYDDIWHVCKFEKTEMNWCEVSDLGSRMLFVSATATSTSLQLTATEGEGMVSFANTIHVADSYHRFDCSSLFYNKGLDLQQPQLLPQIYDWIEEEGMTMFWIQPPQIRG